MCSTLTTDKSTIIRICDVCKVWRHTKLEYGTYRALINGLPVLARVHLGEGSRLKFIYCVWVLSTMYVLKRNVRGFSRWKPNNHSNFSHYHSLSNYWEFFLTSHYFEYIVNASSREPNPRCVKGAHPSPLTILSRDMLLRGMESLCGSVCVCVCVSQCVLCHQLKILISHWKVCL